jgi:hypothetical protein
MQPPYSNFTQMMVGDGTNDFYFPGISADNAICSMVLCR